MPVDDEHATGSMPVRTDTRFSIGLRAAPLAIAMLDTAGLSIDGLVFGALTHVVLHGVTRGAGLSRLRVDGEITRRSPKMVFTSAVLRDESQPDHVIAIGSADWLVQGTPGPDWHYIDPGPGMPDSAALPPLAAAFDVDADDDGFFIRATSTRLGGPMLHHGPIMVALEAHAERLVSGSFSGGIGLRSFDVRFVSSARHAPFRTRGTVTLPDPAIAADPAIAISTVELLDQRATRLALATATYELVQ